MIENNYKWWKKDCNGRILVNNEVKCVLSAYKKLLLLSAKWKSTLSLQIKYKAICKWCSKSIDC